MIKRPKDMNREELEALPENNDDSIPCLDDGFGKYPGDLIFWKNPKNQKRYNFGQLKNKIWFKREIK